MSLTAKRSGNYIMQAVLRLDDNVRLDDFQAAWSVAVQSSTILRTRIVQHERAGLIQVVLQGDIEWQIIEGSGLDDYLSQDKRQSMGLGSILSRFALINDHKQEVRWFAWTIHHAVYDGWSLPRMIALVENIYRGKAVSRPVNFNNFILYTTERQKAVDVENYWNSCLGDGEFAIFPALPATITEPEADATLEMDLAFSVSSEYTAATVIRAALAILISQHTGYDDVVFGAVVSGRNAPVPGIEDMIGPTMATVPVRIKAPKDQEIVAYLKSI